MATDSARSRSGSLGSVGSTGLPTFHELAPARAPTAPAPETRVTVRGFDVRLKVDAAPGCGGIAWPAGEVLSRYLAFRHASRPECLRGKTVLELGSGTGLVGIAAGMLEPKCEIWITDQDILLDLMRQNAVLNEADNVRVAELSWGEPLAGVPTEPDVILAADCVYFEPAFPLLVKTLCDLAPIGREMEILFCWKKRRKADKRFFGMLKKHFDSEIVDDDDDVERARYSREGVTLLRLRRRK